MKKEKGAQTKSFANSLKIGLYTMLLMTLYEWMKQIINPDITIWQSHFITIIWATIVSTVIGYLFLKKEEKLKRQLAKTMSFHQELLDKIPVPVFYKNENHVYLGCNKSYEAFLGMEKQNIIGKTVYDLAPSNLAEAYNEKDKDLSNSLGVQQYEFEVKSKTSGKNRQVIFHKAIFEKSDGQVGGLIGAILDITEMKNAEREKEKTIISLHDALNRVKLLSGLLPICASCKKIRNDQGYWTQIESFIMDHSEAKFSHSICQDCAKKLYPDDVDEDGNILP